MTVRCQFRRAFKARHLFAPLLPANQLAIACPSALIGASNFFELAVATAIGLFGLNSGAALATVVRVLVEIPIMLLVVRAVNSSKGWYEAGRPRNAGAAAND